MGCNIAISVILLKARSKFLLYQIVSYFRSTVDKLFVELSEILCKVLGIDCFDYKEFSDATLHNHLLSTIIIMQSFS
jgi:hypothetical protein